MFHSRNFCTAVGLVFASGICVCTGVWGQSPPKIGEALRQVLPPARIKPADQSLPQFESNAVEPAAKAQLDEPTLEVRAFQIEGNLKLAAATLLALVSDGEGRRLTLSELEALTRRITLHYKSQGYFLAQVFIPEQVVDNGVVHIAVIEGHFGEFKMDNPSRVRDEIVQSIFDQVKADGIVSRKALERALLIVNDTPGVKVADIRVMAGKTEGTSDFEIDTAETAPYSGYALLDNHGSAYTGMNRMSMGLDFNSPSGRGDRLSLAATGSDNGGILDGRAAYSVLLMPNGLRGQVSLGRTQYSLGDIYQPLDAKGTANTLEFTFSYPIHRTSLQTLEATLSWAKKDMQDEIRATETVTPKKVSVATAALSLSDQRPLMGFEGLTQATAALSLGKLWINDASARELDALTQTEGSFGKVVLSATRTSFLPYDFTLTKGLKIQQALFHKNLDAGERLAVSGNGAVGAYPAGELTGSNAALLYVELARPLPAWLDGLQHSWQLFGRWGQASAARIVSIEDERRSLHDVGLGWSGNYRGLVLKLQAARRLAGEPVSEPYPKTKVTAQMGYIF